VITLPPALAAWRAQLDALPSDVTLVLAPWLGPLARALGPMSDPRTSRAGDPDGYRGLARRGSYERLVVAEWAIAEQFPDEFLRRATMGEHMFLELARREPQRALRCIAIVSAGPSQLGAPRLAQLAVLVVLARRAAAAGATFSWGILEDPEHTLIDGFDAAATRRWLDARTTASAAADAMTAWRSAAGDAAPELWFIGGPGDAAAARRDGATCVVVGDAPEPAARALDLELDRSAVPRLRLALPEPALCVRALRNPAGTGEDRAGGSEGRAGARRTVIAADPAAAVRFALGGQRLLVQTASGAVESWPVPNSPSDEVGKRSLWTPPPDRAIVALGVTRRAPVVAVAVASDPPSLELGNGSAVWVRIVLPPRATDALRDWLAMSVRPSPGHCGPVQIYAGRVSFVVEVAGRLVVVQQGLAGWPLSPLEVTAEPLSGFMPVVGTTRSSHALAWADSKEAGAIRIVAATPDGNRPVATLKVAGTPVVHFGCSWRDSEPGWGAAAVAHDETGWVVVASHLPPTRVMSDARVRGVCVRNDEPGLVVQPDPRTLAWQIGSGTVPIIVTSSPIVDVAIAAHRPVVAWVTEAGDVGVHSLAHRALLMRRHAEGEP
jgi:hypothetical protein